jgi:CubicO group peptidase (beta-lactamase class C family)
MRGSHTKDVIVTYPAKTAPGQEFNYNYIVPELLGIILERATGRRYADYLSEKLWQPLGNKTAYLWLNREGGESHQDAGLFSAPTDWLNVGTLLLNKDMFAGRQLVPSAWIDEMRKPSATNPNFGFMYLGSTHAAERRMATDKRVTYTVKASEPFLADDVSYVDGYGGQRVYVVPSKELVVVRVGDFARDYDNAKLVNILIRGIIP